MRGLSTPRWLRDLPVTSKLTGIVLVFVTAIALLLVMVNLSLGLSNGVRAYVGGESLWSKAQKDAVHALNRYASTRSEEDYRGYLRAVEVTLGDRRARLAMERPVIDRDAVLEGFVAGGNDPADVPDMLFLFRYFGRVGHLSDAMALWREADQQMLILDDLARELRRLIIDGRLDPATQADLLRRIDQVNSNVTPLQQNFSARLGEGARWLSGLLQGTILGATTLLLSLGLWISWRIGRELRVSILNLREGALRVARNDLETPIPVRARDEIGKLTETFNDMVAHRRAAETALLSANDFRDRVMENATNAIFAFDLQGRFTLANRKVAEMTGYEVAELLGRPFSLLLAPEDLPGVEEQFRLAAEGRGQARDYQTPILRKDGTRVTVSFSNAPLRGDHGIIGVVGTAEDITERLRTQAELAARADALMRSNDELERFAYAASHDLQEPLRTVASFTQLLAQRTAGRGDLESDEFVGYISDAVHRMRELIQGLLNYSRLSRPMAELEPVELDGLLQAALDNLQAAIRESGATIHRQPLPRLAVPGGQIAQVFQNLIGNAVKFRGEAPPEVWVSAERRGEEWRFCVRDNGIGIDPQYAERVFVLFQRLHTRDVYSGSGLGLAICKKTIERLGGRIWVEPAQPGSAFYFTLPA